MKLNRMMSVFALVAALVAASVTFAAKGRTRLEVSGPEGQHRNRHTFGRKRQEHSARIG